VSAAVVVVVVVVGAVVMAEGNAGDGRRKDKRRRSIRGGRDEKQQERNTTSLRVDDAAPTRRESVRWIGASWADRVEWSQSCSEPLLILARGRWRLGCALRAFEQSN